MLLKMKTLSTLWHKKSCDKCKNEFPVHKDWVNPPTHCGPCRLISQKFVDAVEFLVKESVSEAPIDTKRTFLKLLQKAGSCYRQKKFDGENQVAAWLSTERDLAYIIWNDKNLRVTVLKCIKKLKFQRREDARADKCNEIRSARLSNRTRRWSG